MTPPRCLANPPAALASGAARVCRWLQARFGIEGPCAGAPKPHRAGPWTVYLCDAHRPRDYSRIEEMEL